VRIWQARCWSLACGAAVLAAASVHLAGASAAAGKPSPSGSGRPNVVLITIDTLRPDGLGWVAHRNATPEIDALAASGFRFPAAVSPVPLTLPSHTSIFSGWLPRHHGVRRNGDEVPHEVPLLADRLAKAGYATAAFVSGYPLRAEFGLDRGFGVYDDRLPAGRDGWLERPAEKTVDAAVAWLHAAKAPWFLWVHFYDPHDPYDPPIAFRQPGPRGRYDGEIAYVDHEVGRLARALRDRRESVLTILTADHGEAFEEHGESGHGFFIYDDTILVPLVVSWAGRVRPGESLAPARLIDVTPTVLDLVGLPAAPAADGRTLRPLLAGATKTWAGSFVETEEPWTEFGWSPLAAWREDGWKLIRAPENELYDLRSDPGEVHNRVGSDRRQARGLAQSMAAVERGPRGNAAASDDTQAVAALRSLGYLGAGNVTSEPPPGLPDPKDKLALRALLVAGESLLKAGRVEEAIARFERVRASDPDDRFANLRSGVAWLMANQPARAIPLLERAVKLDPAQPEAQFALADAYVRTQRFSDALPHWMETVRQQPRRAGAWSNLGVTLGSMGRISEAVVALRRAVAADPADAGLHANLGQGLLAVAGSDAAAGKMDSARSELREALNEDPSLRAAAGADRLLVPLLPPEPAPR